MRLTAKQEFVLSNLERVTPRPYKLTVQHPFPRYDLDGWECTAQITGLTVRGAIERSAEGELVRRPRTQSFVRLP